MVAKVVPTQDLNTFATTCDALRYRPDGLPGMGLAYGPTGYGKTTAVRFYTERAGGIYLRALRVWRPRALLAALARHLDLDVRGLTNGEAFDLVSCELMKRETILFFDEADYLAESRSLLDLVRDLHDITGLPIVLVGMEGIEKKVRRYPLLTGRIAHWMSFQGISMEDAKLLAEALARVEIADDLLQDLHQRSCPNGRDRGELRRFVVGLRQIETVALRRGLERIRLRDFRGQDYFLGAPVQHPKVVTIGE